MQDIDFILNYLLKETGRDNFDYSSRNKENLYRALVNVRPPRAVSDEFLKCEKSFLKSLINEEDIIDCSKVKTAGESYKTLNINNKDKIAIIKADLCLVKADAIVNPANSQGLGCFKALHSCLDNQIHTKAGVSLRLACNEYMKTIDYNLGVSECFITEGFNLPASHVIHAVGPMVNGDFTDELKEKLAKTYTNCLECAIRNNIRTIAFPAISTGVFRFPKEEAAKIAISVVDDFLSRNTGKLDKVIFCLWESEDVNSYERYI